MPKTFPLVTIVLTVILMALAACTGATPPPEATETPAPSPIAAATPVPANTPAPTETPPPTPTERPTTAPTETPASPPSPTAPGPLVPLDIQDRQALESGLSEAELDCIGGPERLARTLAGPSMAPREEQAELFGCLEDETLDRLFLAGFVAGPLSPETSECVREVFEVIDPRAVMTAGMEGDPGRAMAGSMAAFMVTTACLNDEEWEETSRMTAMSSGEREDARCLMSALGGPGQMAEAMAAAGEGDFAALAGAGEECGLDMGPPPGQSTAIPPPTPTATTEAPTPTAAATTPASTPTPTPMKPVTTLVITVAEIPDGIPEYKRSEWKHWVDDDGDCQDARQEVLIEESLDPVTFEDDRRCRAEMGRWWAPHLGHHLENPRQIDVDHHVPLKNAHLSGGWRWDDERKEEYANYLEDPAHLVAISSRHNRSKGARGPEEWAPPDNALWCQYALDWTEIKQRWDLSMTPRESEIVMDMLDTCEDPPTVEVETLDYPGTVTGEDKPTAENQVYASCEEAERAGEERIQGNQGGGQGFPKAMVPSARDGDGDGVVCER